MPRWRFGTSPGRRGIPEEVVEVTVESGTQPANLPATSGVEDTSVLQATPAGSSGSSQVDLFADMNGVVTGETQEAANATGDSIHSSHDSVFNAEKVIGHQIQDGQDSWKVQWENSEVTTWEPTKHLERCGDLIEGYLTERRH